MKHILFTVLVVALFGCNTYYQTKNATTENLRVQTSAPADSETHPLEAIIEPYKSSLDEQMNNVIGSASKALKKERPESSLGNWIADALQNQVNQHLSLPVDVTIQNYGGIRIPEIPPGPIRTGKIYELMPFDNMVVVMNLSGLMTQRLFDHMAAGGGWPVSKEAQYVLQQGRAKQLKIHGKPIQAEATYRIALPDYVANGGNDCDFLKDIPREDTGQLVRDLLIDEVKEQASKGQRIEASIDGRVRMGD